jgi:8-oxo-dGTP diphosphatase
MQIRRDLPFPGEPERLETDGEHAFTLAMVALSVNERLNLGLSSGKIAEYALVHDLVEVHAGDVPVKANESEHAKKEAREHEAYKTIKADFAELFPWVHTTIEKYESKKEAEAQFVFVVDKYMGALAWLASGGKNWARNYPEENDQMYGVVFERLRAKVKKFDQSTLLELFDSMHGKLREKRSEFFNQPLVLDRQVRVGVGVFVCNDDGSFLMLKRKNAHGSGTWAPPGGHIEFGESVEACAVREVKEETGLDITDVVQFATTNDIFDEGKHYITLHVKAKWNGEVAKIMEPEKCSDLGWFTKDSLPSPLFKTLENLGTENFPA